MSLTDFFKKSSAQPRCSAVIVAAGSSVRMGSDKLSAELGGMSVLARTLHVFDRSDYVSEIVIVTRRDKLEEVSDLVAEEKLEKVTKVVAGGKTRMESSLIGVSAVKSGAKLIAIHDGARPLLSEALIKRTVCAAAEHHAAVPVLPSVDTLKTVDENNRLIGTVDRETTYRVQTPQVFDALLIKGALSKAADGAKALSDDSSALDLLGIPTFAVAGEDDNIKLTTPRDFMIAEAVLRQRGEL